MTHFDWLEAVESACAWAEYAGGNTVRLKVARSVLRMRVVSAVVRAVLARKAA